MKKLYVLVFVIWFTGILNSSAQTEFRLDSTHVSSWFTDDWALHTRELYTFENKGTKETNLLRLVANGSSWDNYYQRNKIYNSDNNMTENIQQNWESESWINKVRETYTYDALGRETTYIHAIRVSGAWGSTKREIKTYSNNKLDTKTFEEGYAGATLVPHERYLYNYEASSGRLSEEIEQIYYADVDVWQSVGKIKYSYTSFGALELVEEIGLNQSTGEFNDFATQQTLYSYNALQQPTEQVFQLRIGEDYRNLERYVFVYTLGNQTELIIQEWVNASSTWLNKSRQLRTFNTDNNETSLIYQSWDTDNEIWEGFVRIDSFWSASEDFEITLSANNPYINESVVSIYPNPVANFITINTSETVNSVTLFNLQGKQIMFQKNETILNVSQLESGMYIAKIDCGNHIETKKVLIKN